MAMTGVASGNSSIGSEPERSCPRPRDVSSVGRSGDPRKLTQYVTHQGPDSHRLVAGYQRFFQLLPQLLASLSPDEDVIDALEAKILEERIVLHISLGVVADIQDSYFDKIEYLSILHTETHVTVPLHPGPLRVRRTDLHTTA